MLGASTGQGLFWVSLFISACMAREGSFTYVRRELWAKGYFGVRVNLGISVCMAMHGSFTHVRRECSDQGWEYLHAWFYSC